MVSTRRKPKPKSFTVAAATVVMNPTNADVSNFHDPKNLLVASDKSSLPHSSLGSIVVTSNDIHHHHHQVVSDNSSNTSAGSSHHNINSDNSTVETTTATTALTQSSSSSLLQLPLITTTTNAHNNNNNNNTKASPKKKSSKPLKSSLKQSSSSIHRSNNTPPLSGYSSSSSPYITSLLPPVSKRYNTAFGVTSNAHTRSNAGTAELLKGVDTNVSSSRVNGGINNNHHHHTTKSSSTKRSNIGNLMIGKNMNKQLQQKESKYGILTMRNGISVRKIIMSTGTLYIDINTHRAEFVRTK